MTTSELERRLADVLRDRAEDAMERTNTQAQLSALLAENERDLERRPWRWAAGAVVAAAAAAVAVAVWLGQGDETAEPAPARGPGPVVVAASFIDASYAYDLDRAEAMLSPDAVIIGSTGNDLRTEYAWNQAAGVSLADHSCQELSTSEAGTRVHCTFALHALGSEQLGRGPYGSNSLYVTVLDGKITRVQEIWPFSANGFAEEAWEPFAAWVAAEHPADARVMYTDDSYTGASNGPRSLRLWEHHVAEYIDAQR